MKPTLVHPSWHDVEKATALIAHQTIKTQFPVGWVIGLTRGGLVPAVIFSQMVDVPMMPANYSSRTGAGDNKNHNNILPVIGSARNILIIDDICDTGHTLEEVRQHYLDQNHDVKTAALYYKESSIHVPDFFVHKIPADSPWVIFPWEC